MGEESAGRCKEDFESDIFGAWSAPTDKNPMLNAKQF